MKQQRAWARSVSRPLSHMFDRKGRVWLQFLNRDTAIEYRIWRSELEWRRFRLHCSFIRFVRIVLAIFLEPLKL